MWAQSKQKPEEPTAWPQRGASWPGGVAPVVLGSGVKRVWGRALQTQLNMSRGRKELLAV